MIGVLWPLPTRASVQNNPYTSAHDKILEQRGLSLGLSVNLRYNDLQFPVCAKLYEVTPNHSAETLFDLNDRAMIQIVYNTANPSAYKLRSDLTSVH